MLQLEDSGTHGDLGVVSYGLAVIFCSPQCSLRLDKDSFYQHTLACTVSPQSSCGSEISECSPMRITSCISDGRLCM
jgi:hypothetical protein